MDEDYNIKNLEKVIIEKSCKIGFLENDNREKSLEISKLEKTLNELVYEDVINVSTLETELEHEDSRSLVRVESDFPTYEATVSGSMFREPSLYKLAANDNYNTHAQGRDRNLYISGSAKYGGPNYVFSEPTGAMATANRISIDNKVYKFFYTSSADFDRSSRYTTNPTLNFYSSKSLNETDLDPEYQYVLALNRSFYEGVKNTIHTTLDGDLPIIVRTSAPTVAVPTDVGISKLKVDKNT